MSMNQDDLLSELFIFSKQSPQSYDADVNWENLVKAYSDPNPRDYFYKSVFNMTYAEKLADEAKKDNIDEDEDNK